MMDVPVNRLVDVFRVCPKCGSRGKPIRLTESYVRVPSRLRHGHFTEADHKYYKLADAEGNRVEHKLASSQCDDCGIDRLHRHVEPVPSVAGDVLGGPLAGPGG